MAKSAAHRKRDDADPVIVTVCRNRRATHDYEISDRLECGVVLVGTEVKSLREGHANLENSYAKLAGGELFLVGAEIPEYLFGNRLNHAPSGSGSCWPGGPRSAGWPARPSRRGSPGAAEHLLQERPGQGRGRVAKGKQVHDKRHALKASEAKRDMARALVERRRKR